MRGEARQLQMTRIALSCKRGEGSSASKLTNTDGEKRA